MNKLQTTIAQGRRRQLSKRVNPPLSPRCITEADVVSDNPMFVADEEAQASTLRRTIDKVYPQLLEELKEHEDKFLNINGGTFLFKELLDTATQLNFLNKKYSEDCHGIIAKLAKTTKKPKPL